MRNEKWLWRPKPDCPMGAEFTAAKRHKSMTGGSSISAYYIACLDNRWSIRYCNPGWRRSLTSPVEVANQILDKFRLRNSRPHGLHSVFEKTLDAWISLVPTPGFGHLCTTKPLCLIMFVISIVYGFCSGLHISVAMSYTTSKKTIYLHEQAVECTKAWVVKLLRCGSVHVQWS
jgi:hypothetical protein